MSNREMKASRKNIFLIDIGKFEWCDRLLTPRWRVPGIVSYGNEQALMPSQVQHITLVRSSIHYTHGYIKSLWPVMVRVCNVEQILWVVYIKWIPEWTLAFITPDTDSTHHRNSWRPIFQGQD